VELQTTSNSDSRPGARHRRGPNNNSWWSTSNASHFATPTTTPKRIRANVSRMGQHLLRNMGCAPFRIFFYPSTLITVDPPPPQMTHFPPLTWEHFTREVPDERGGQQLIPTETCDEFYWVKIKSLYASLSRHFRLMSGPASIKNWGNCIINYHPFQYMPSAPINTSLRIRPT
jgi:hypothetical protein